ncbi:MAG TPA: TIGR00725 family protein [Actinomycetota bacterium]
MARTRAPYVVVCGSGQATTQEVAWAEEVGRLVADAGAVLVCGGLGGVMDAAARGCEAGGGLSIGILPGEHRDPASPHLTVSIPTGLGEARNALVVRAADAVIAIGGEFGTLSEIALALKAGTPVVGLHTWELAKAGSLVHAIIETETPQEAVRAALEAIA